MGEVVDDCNQVVLFQNTEGYVVASTGGTGSRVVGQDAESGLVKKLADREHLILRVAVPACQDDGGMIFSGEKTAIQWNMIVTLNLDVFRMKIGESGQAPVVRVVTGMERSLRSDPADCSKERECEQKETGRGPQ